MLTVDDFSAEYIISKAHATGQTTEEIVHTLVNQEIAAM
jgi:hypothetical protein